MSTLFLAMTRAAYIDTDPCFFALLDRLKERHI
jgi:hypothetical protein